METPKNKTVALEYLFLLGLSIAFFETFIYGDYLTGLTWLMFSIIIVTLVIKRYTQGYYTKENWRRHILFPLIVLGVIDIGSLFPILLMLLG